MVGPEMDMADITGQSGQAWARRGSGLNPTDTLWRLSLRVCCELVLRIPEGGRQRPQRLPSSTQGGPDVPERQLAPLFRQEIGRLWEAVLSQAPFPGQVFYLKKCAFWRPGLYSI